MTFEFQHQSAGAQIVSLAEGLKAIHTFVTMEDTKEIYLYNKEEGNYQRAETTIESTIKNDPACRIVRKHMLNDVLYHIQTTTYRKREEFDNDPEWLHVDNGWVNIKTGEFKKHTPEMLSLSKMPVKYDPSAKCLRIKDFLKSTLDDENIAKVVRMWGYCLMPTNKYEASFFFVGSGANGKSTTVSLTEAFIGKDNISNIPIQKLHERFATARLYGKWLNTFADIPNKKIAETGTFKALVSGDSVYAENKGKDGFSFKSRAKMIFSANELPQSENETPAFFRRLVIIPFRRTFEGDKADKNLIDKLTTEEELSGLFNVALAGMKALEEEGGFREESIERIRSVCESNASRVKDFIDEMCVLEQNASIEANRLQESYRQYSLSKGDKVFDETMLGKELKRLGIQHRQKRIDGRRPYVYEGISLKGEVLSYPS